MATFSSGNRGCLSAWLLLTSWPLVGIALGCGAVSDHASRSGASSAKRESAAPSTMQAPSSRPTASSELVALQSRPVVLWAENRTCFIGVRFKHVSVFIQFHDGDPIPVSPGTVIEVVLPDSPAGRAGLLPGDAIVSLNGVSTRMDDEGRFVARIADFLPGDDIMLGISRSGKEFPVKLKLGRRPSATMP